jgi:hypothetical protein
VDDLDLTKPPDVVKLFARMLEQLGKLPVSAASAHAVLAMNRDLRRERELAEKWQDDHAAFRLRL